MICVHKKKGFTLIEILIALFILSVTVLFVTIVLNMIKVTRDIAFENQAFRLASSKLEELRAGGYDALPAEGSFTDPELTTLPQGTASTSIAVYNTKTKQVAVGVSWLGASGSTKYVRLTTLITQVGGL